MSDEIKKYMSIMESFYMSSPYTQNSQSEDKENITYSKTKKKGDSSVTVSANADSMDELHDILKLAGITLPKSDSHDHEHDHEHDHDEEPKQGEYADMCDGCGKPGDECECEDCDAHGDEEKPKMSGKPVVISLKPKGMGYNPVSGDKKEILNALMNRYRSL